VCASCIEFDKYSEMDVLTRHGTTQRDEIGRGLAVNGAWGARQLQYCDLTASGRSLLFIESFIANHVLPLYANTHRSVLVSSHFSVLLMMLMLV
jgi:selenocysteine lyase/cysteine desulfurase